MQKSWAIPIILVLLVGAAPPTGAAPVAAAPASAVAQAMPPVKPDQPPLEPDRTIVPGARLIGTPTSVHWGERYTIRIPAAPDVKWSFQDGFMWTGTSKLTLGGSTVIGKCDSTIDPKPGQGYSCTYVAPTPGDWGFPGTGWAVFEVLFSRPSMPAGSTNMTYGRVYVAIVPPEKAVLSGILRDDTGAGVRSVRISVVGAGRTTTTSTGPDGSYALLLTNGTYTVTPKGSWDPAKRVVTIKGRGVTADFRAATPGLSFRIDGSRLVSGLDWTTVPATGLAWRSGTLKATDAHGGPIADEAIQIDRPYFDGSAPGQVPAPRISLCDATTWRPIFTSTDRVERITDGSGEVGFTIMFGTEPSTSLLHARIASGVTALDVERLAQQGTVTGPSTSEITTPMQNAAKLGLPAPPMFALSAGSLQATLTEWWLAYRAGDQVGPARMLPAGDFVPVRTRDNKAAAIVFYPAGNPAPLRDHLATGAPLPAGYATSLLTFRQVPFTPTGDLLQWQVVLNDLPSLAAWESANGPATDGFLLNGSGLGTAGWLGGPIPPSIVDRTARAAYARCVPGASPPTIAVEVHSPVQVTLTEGDGGFAIPASRGAAATYVVPGGSQSLALSGTGSGPAVIVVRTGDDARAFAFASTSGATGTVALSAAADPQVTFAGKAIRAGRGVALRMSGGSTSLRVGRSARLGLRVTDGFRTPVANALVTVRGAGVAVSGRTDAKGTVRLVVRPTARGTVVIAASAPGSRPARMSATAR
ncbi:MAG: hypothetical protein IPO93_09885 [Actinobacteria bacterium]|nr:hypothetical protein [Actinomycetota bacterium]